jgi:hypothetical protein
MGYPSTIKGLNTFISNPNPSVYTIEHPMLWLVLKEKDTYLSTCKR